MSKKVHPTKINQSEIERSSNDIFIELNIRYRKCYKFQPKKNDTEEIFCACNRIKDEHDEKIPIKGSEWSMRHNTVEKVYPDHGLLPNGAWFIRLALDTPVEKAERILLDMWKIPKPRLIISIIGGAKYFALNDRLETNFINGLIHVALKSNAWLLTTGYNVGIVQLVGQAINKFNFTNPNKRITAIGICKWGSIKNVENVTKSPDKKGKPKTTNRSNTLEDNQNQEEHEHGEHDLEMNHSHYLMLDDGTIRHYDTEDYRTRLAVQIGKLQHENDFPLPVVTIVVEGGKDTIANIYYDLRENIPVVIIGGSGRVADFYTRWKLYTKEFDNITKENDWNEICDIDELKEIIPPSSSSESTNQNNQSSLIPIATTTKTHIHLDRSLERLRNIFKKYKDQLEDDLKNTLLINDKSGKNVHNLAKQVMYCLQPAVRSNIVIFNLNSDNNLSEIIFRSICQSRQKYSKTKDDQRKDIVEISQRRLKPPYTLSMKKRHLESHNTIHKHDESATRSQLLKLAMNWDCIDVAKEFILKNSLDNILDRNQRFMDALTDNLPTFIYEFIKLGIDLCEIFFPKEDSFEKDRYKNFIKNLYTTKAVNSDKTHLKDFLQGDTDVSLKQIHTVDTLNDILTILIGDYMYKLYFNNQKDEREHRVRQGLVHETEEDNENINKQQYNLNNKKKQLPNDYIMRDLFIWAILMNYIDMAKVFLSHMKYRICPALIATKILKQYHHKAAYGELKDGYLKNAIYFEQYAIDCLDKCDDNDADQACQIVLQRNEIYGYVTCLQVAADAGDKLFLATPCCVQAMDNVWYDKIIPEKSPTNKCAMFFGIITFGLLAPIFVTFRTSGQEPRNEALEQSLEFYGVNYSDPYAVKYHGIQHVAKKYISRLINFHRALYVKFLYHIINYIFFLLLFSYVLLFKFQPPTNKIPSIHWTEILTIIFVLCMLIEEFRYFFSLDSVTFCGKFWSYFRNFFKQMTVIGFVLFVFGLGFRFSYRDTEDQFTVARIIMAIDLEIWWLRSLAFMIAIPFLGPHLVAIGKMLKDLGFFMCIIVIVMLGYGVSSRSMVYYPNADKFNTTTKFDGRSIFREIAYPVYYLMYGEFKSELTNLDAYRDAGWSITNHILVAIHMVFVNILLINLLIAIFSKRYDEVFEDTKNIWHFQQYLYTREYYTRSPFFPPISLFYDIYYLCRMTFYFIRWQCFNKEKDCKTNVFKMIPKNEAIIKEWYEFEGASTYEYAHNEVKALTKSFIESDFHNIVKKEEITHKTNNFRNNYKQIQEELTKLDTSIERIKEELKTSIEDVKGELQQTIGTIKTKLDELTGNKTKTS